LLQKERIIILILLEENHNSYMAIQFLQAKWKNLVMANYAVDPALLEPLLPAGTKLDYYQGKAYVSLVGFLFAKTKIFGIPVPRFGTFEEINLRFYVVRNEGNIKRRGVVFVNEAVPFKPVARMANFLYNERYTVLPTKHYWDKNSRNRLIEYYWENKGNWNAIKVEADTGYKAMAIGSMEEFILEHYYGYTKVTDTVSESYQIDHVRWMTFPVRSYDIDCDFESMYGPSFAHLTGEDPSSVMLARGSDVYINLKRKKIEIS
jgi:uncharacterized protein YqjF (DUF2071 family)